MASADLPQLRRRARWGYERTRLREAVLGVMPIAAVVLLVAAVGRRPPLTLAVGAAAALWGALLLWYGRGPQKAVLPGFVAGLVPLILVLAANHVHMCGADECTSLCMYACAIGGLGAGLGVSVVAYRRGAGLGFWLSASGMALLTGAVACASVGHGGIAGVVLGFGAGALSGRVQRGIGRRAS